MKAMILAAGEGTRLRPLTLALPKPMVPIANRPLLVRTLEMLARDGIVDVAVNLYHRPQAILDALSAGTEPERDGLVAGSRVTFSHEQSLMGTAGGVKCVEPFLSDGTFLVLYGDNLYDVDLAPLIAYHREKGALATIATFEAANPSACGLILTDDAGRITRFQEKPPPEEVFTREANAGVYVLEPDVFPFIPPHTACDFGRDIFPVLLQAIPGSLYAVRLSGYLQDTGTVSAYRQANWDVLEGRASAREPLPGTRCGAAVLIGPATQLSSSADLVGRNVVGARCAIGEGARLEESILWDDCRVGARADVRCAILGRGVRIGDGAVVGEGAILADGVVVDAGAMVPEDARIGPGETVLRKGNTSTA